MDKDIETYIGEKYFMDDEDIRALRVEGESKNIPIILRDTEAYLVHLLRMRRPKKIVEIGTAIGYSAALFASVCQDATVVSLERNNSMTVKAEANIEKLSLGDRVFLLSGDGRSIESLVRGRFPHVDFDFVFIDGGKGHYKEFWDGAMKLSKSGTLVVCDNVLMQGRVTLKDENIPRRLRTSVRRMRKFLDYITNSDGINTIILPIGDGLSVSYVE